MNELLQTLEQCKINSTLNFKINNEYSELCNWRINPIYSKEWKEKKDDEVPYEIITHALDAYSLLPERPDLAFELYWKAINNSYNEILLKQSNVDKLQDTKGLEEFVKLVNQDYLKYENLLKPFYENMPLKTCRFVASYILKGIALEDANLSPKYISSSYHSFKKRFNNFYDKIRKSYGEKYKMICNVSECNAKITFGITDKKASKELIKSLAKKIQILIKTDMTSFTKFDSSESYEVNFNNKNKIEFLLFSILYATRCNNFHGNVSSRLRSQFANKETYFSNKYIFVLAHIFLVIALNINGYICVNDLQEYVIENDFWVEGI